jgi:CHRD domain
MCGLWLLVRKGVRMVTRLSKLRALLVVGALAMIAVTAGFAAAKSVKVRATMTSGQVVVPRKPFGDVRDATGTFAGTLAQSRARWWLAWKITYRNLDHPIIVIADIHRGKPGKFGPVLVRLCGPCRSGAHGVKVVKASDVPVIKSGRAFITLITARNPNGEVRGQIVVR